MDPLSLTVAIVSLLKACAQLSKTLTIVQRIKDASGLVDAMNNEVSDLRLILMHLNDYFESVKDKESGTGGVDESIFKLCSSTLDQTSDKLKEVENLMGQLIKPQKNKESKINRAAFLRQRGYLLNLQTDVRFARQKLSNIFGQLGIRDLSRIEVLLSDIRANDLSTLRQSQTRAEENYLAIRQEVDRQSLMSNAVSRILQDARSSDPSGSEASNVEITVSRLRYKNGRLRSRCQCHRRSATIGLHTLLGSIFLGYAVIPLASRCRPDCSCHKSIEFRLSYFFPIWFLKYAISVQTGFSTTGNITFSLSFKQLLPDDHIVLALLVAEDLDGIRELLVSGQVSVDAKIPGYGNILQSILMGTPATTRMFIEMGADMFMDCSPRLSPYELVWTLILANRSTSIWRHQLRSLFPDPDFDEMYGFNALYRAVIGLTGSHSMQSVLRAQPNLINEADNSGKTALHWAAQRADKHAICTLLSYGANPNQACNSGNRPLLHAATSSWECMNLFLKAGAEPYAKSGNGDNALHFVGQSSNLPGNEAAQIADSLVKTGMDINAINGNGETALMRTYLSNHVEVAKCLLNRGAAIDTYNFHGENVLWSAVAYNHHTLIDLLVSNGLDHTTPNKQGKSFLHAAAEVADTKSLQLLSRGNLKCRNINIKNQEGKTPYNLALQRRNVDLAWRHAFSDFLSSVNEDLLVPEDVSAAPAGPQDFMGSGGDRPEDTVLSEGAGSDDDFEDAVEVQV